jgi:MFS family permease
VSILSAGEIIFPLHSHRTYTKSSPAGTFFGALGAAPVADRIGRRFSLIASCWVFIFGVILQTAATSLPLFVAGRFFAGFGVGLVSALSRYCGSYILRIV